MATTERIILDPSTGYGTRRNLCTNPSFEVDATNWSTAAGIVNSGATISRASDTAAPVGSYVGFVDCTGASTLQGAYNLFNLTSGVTYTVRLYAKWLNGGPLAFKMVRNSSPFTEYVIATGVSPTGWTAYTFTFTPTFTGQYALLVESLDATATQFSVDKIQVVEEASVGTYFDGSGYVNDSGVWSVVPDFSWISFAWDGTAHASASTLTVSRVPLDITPWVSVDGIDWGDAAVSATFAELRAGAVPVDFSVPARQIGVPLKLRDMGGTTFATIRSTLQAKAGLWQAQGGVVKRVLDSGGTVYVDITDAALRLSGDWTQAHQDVDIAASLSLTAIPDFYKSEEVLTDHTETTLPEITFTESTVNGGDFPLGDRVRVVVDDDQAQNQRGLFWAFRGRHYSAATTAAPAFEAEALQALDTATKVAKVGASGGTVVTHGTLSTNWTPVLGTNIGGTSWLTHTGTYRAYARVFTTSGTTVQSRFVWDTADLVYPVENDAVRCYSGGTFHILDLGEIRLDRSPTGTHRWQGMIQGKGDAGGENFSVDRVWFANADESSGVCRAPANISLGLSTYSARSEFSTESGAITGDSLAVGGAWTVLTSSDTDDFSVSGGVATRATTGDTAPRGVTAGSTNYTSLAASVDLKVSALNQQSGYIGLVARSSDVTNMVRAYINLANLNQWYLTVDYLLAGSLTNIAFTPIVISADTYYTLRLLTLTDGVAVVQLSAQGQAAPMAIAAGVSSVLATGGSLASGRVGIIDANSGATATTRTFDNFTAWVPTDDAVIYASRSAELNTKGITRTDTGGTASGPVSFPYGDLPRMPNQSSAGTVEFIAKASRGDMATLADPGIDDISARAYRRASYLTVG